MASCAFLIAIYVHHKREGEVEGIDVVLRGTKDHKICIFGTSILYSYLPIDKYTYVHKKIYGAHR